MPKIDINSKSSSSAMPEMKTAPSKPRYGQGLNATAYHHSGSLRNVTKITSTKKIETPERIEIKTETEIFTAETQNPNKEYTLKNSTEHQTTEPKKIEIHDYNSEKEPELVDNLDNFDEEKGNYDLEMKEDDMEKSKKNKKKLGKGIKILSIVVFALFALSTLIFLYLLLPTGSLPIFYIPVFILLPIIFTIFTFFDKFKKIPKIICMLFEIGFIFVFVNAAIATGTLTGFLDKIFANNDYAVEEYYVIVKNNSPFEKIEDLNDHSIAIYNDISDNYQKALEEFSKKSTAEQKPYADFSDASFALLNDETDSLLLKGALKDTVEEFVKDYNENTPENQVPAFNENNIRILDTIEIKTEIKHEDLDENFDLSTEPFNVFISGIDTYGSISTVSRSDVNMIATVNPKTHKILLTSIPRDYYVQLHETVGLKDKLTHAGIYGVDMSRQTLEDLFGIDIKFFVRVNFSSVVNIVDAIGGITITSDLAFSGKNDSYSKVCYYSVGENNVDGDCALRFARERHAYAEGDRHRVQNQQEVLSAIIGKVSSSRVLISKYSEILNSLSDNIQTNVPPNQIYKLVNAQLSSMPSWSVDRISVDGAGAMDYTYSMPSQPLYIMIPDESTVDAAKRKIRETLGLEVEPEPEELAPEEEIISEE